MPENEGTETFPVETEQVTKQIQDTITNLHEVWKFLEKTSYYCVKMDSLEDAKTLSNMADSISEGIYMLQRYSTILKNIDGMFRRSLKTEIPNIVRSS